MLTIVWDVDDVLNDLTRCWLDRQWLPAHPGCGLDFSHLAENPPHQIIGAAREEYLASLDGFRISGYAQIEPDPQVLAWFKANGHKARHAALTSTPLCAANISAQWVIRHFGLWIRSFNFVPSERRGQSSPIYDLNKAAFLKWLGHVDIFVDDNSDNVHAAESAGIMSVLIAKPWNKNGLLTVDALSKIDAIIEKG